MEVGFDKYSLIINDKRTLIKSGSIHYFRTIGEDAWRDRLSKMKAGGYNAVDIYLCWNFHTKNQGEYDFQGYRDISKLFDIAREIGLYVIVRPGPYVNAEISGGGLPFWLLKDKDVIPRNRQNGDYIYSPKYMEYLKEWYNKVLPIIKQHEDNIILIQVENEYSTNGCEEDYIRELYDIVKSYDIKAPIFHNDAYISGLYADCVDIYACDIYPYINPKDDWRTNNYVFGTLDNLEEISRSSKENAPIFVAELQAGWYDKWLGYGYDYIRQDMGLEHINIMTKTALSQGVTIFNHYMTAGGTNILDMASDEVYTNYDFAAPISEFGLIKDNFRKAKEINYFLDAFDLSETEPSDIDFEVTDNCYAKKRIDLKNNCEWLFLRNFNTCETPINKININSFDMKILPQNLKLRGCEIIKSGLEIFTKIENEKEEWLFLISDEKNSITIKNLENNEEKIISGDMENYIILDYNQTKIVFLNYNILNKTWKINNKLIFGADFVYPNGKIALRENKTIKTFEIDHGFSEKEYKISYEPLKLKLSNFDVSFCAQEIEKDYDYSNWKDIKGETDSFASGVFSEFVWYKAKISNKIKEISINARHIFAIYINGCEVLNRNSYKYDNMQSVDEQISVNIKPELYTSENENELTILVQNLGFDRGFSNNMEPRGLISFKTDNDEKINWKIRGRISLDKREYSENQAPYLALLTKKFKIEKDYLSNKVYAPFILDMEHTPFRRATIFLNGIKIGRYIRHNSYQTKFYLLNEFLKEENELKIVVWEKSHRILSTLDFKQYLESIVVKAENFKVYEMFDD